MDQIINSGGQEILDEDDAIAAETWASAILSVFEGARQQAKLDRLEVPPFEESLLERCRQRRDKRSLAVAAALADVLSPSLAPWAASVAAELRRAVPGRPKWTNSVGAVQPTRGWMSSDVFGDQDSLIVGFQQEGEPNEHALVVLIDHNLSGQAKDAWIAPDLDDVVTAWTANLDSHMRLTEMPIEEALGRLAHAMATSDLWNGDADLRTEDFARHRALIWSRLRRSGFGDIGPADREVDPTERATLIREFMDSNEGRVLAIGHAELDLEILVHYLVDLRCDYEGQPLRWSPIVVSIILGDLAPRKLLLDADQASVFPAVVRAFVRFSAQLSGLDAPFLEEILASVDQMEPDFFDRIGDPAAAGPAKAVLAALQARGVDLTDIEAVNQALEQGDGLELPFDAAPPRRRPTASAEVVAAAETAQVLARLASLTGFYDSGRKLTQTGQPTLADARALVPLLGTRDRMDETFGGRAYRTRSAAELPELSFTIRWAIAAGALRKDHGQLRATATWHKLEGKPLQRWTRAADALVSLGPLATYQANRFRGEGEVLDELMPEIFRLLRERPTPFEDVLDSVCDTADAMYDWLSLYMQDPENRRRSFAWDLDLLVRTLGCAGIADRLDARAEPDPYQSERLVGGTLRLTPVGRWWLSGI